MSAILGALLVTAAFTDASANSGHLAVGLNSSSGYVPVEPGWQGPVASAVGCVGLAGWWITGGHDYAGPRGQVMRTADDRRWGATADLCPTTTGAWLGAVGFGYGQQYGGNLYVTPSITAGLAAFAKSGPQAASYGSISPFIEPKLALGLALPPGLSIEFGPTLMLAPSVLRAMEGPRPAGMFVGQAGFELTVLAGAASPHRPWRR